ncbi:uncharacterized protein LOC107433272 isoform X2 [Ziziphus jujuba]|uniref:Uncharacterized protein LOC107433272 isoform X2 n=1 Tax=Ziziphus jujuba TaxID=326968 RepID=A0ABM3I5H1_ZIZJJ|nr:uncharacterized protein LOC107433272 isoform X2 [Ziziphus jujuba]
MDLNPTKLDYYEDMWKLHSKATVVSYSKGNDGKEVLILENTIFHPQGGGQPADTGVITTTDTVDDSDFKFVVQDVRSKDGVVHHYGFVENSGGQSESKFEVGKEVFLYVDESRRKLNARPFVEYKGKADPKQIESKLKELEIEANTLISKGGKVFAAVLPYGEASEICGGSLPDYIPKDSTPRIVKLGETPAYPCGGTHVYDISDITSITVSHIRTKKGLTKIFYNVGA